MTFYDRYSKLCIDRGIEPCSKTAADLIGVSKATISVWNKKKSTPMGEIVHTIADAFHVSADYLLGRIDDPTDYTNPDLVADMAGSVLNAFDGDTKKAAEFHLAVDADAARESMPKILRLYTQLDDVDKAKVESYIDGMLTAEKYASGKSPHSASFEKYNIR